VELLDEAQQSKKLTKVDNGQPAQKSNSIIAHCTSRQWANQGGASMLRKGDRVVMHTCMEASLPKYEGKIFTCTTDEQKLHESHKYTVVWLEGVSGCFATEYLAKYTTPKKALEIYAATEEENRAAIRELRKQLIQRKTELAKKTGLTSNIETPDEHARQMEKFWEGDES
jgi:hypothetical protein